MNSKDLYNAFQDIDDDILERSDSFSRKKTLWITFAAAACLLLVIGAIALLPHIKQQSLDPQPGGFVLSPQSTATVSYDYDYDNITSVSKDSLVYFTEEEMFAFENQYIFRGVVKKLTNIVIDFKWDQDRRCLAEIEVTKVYKGDISVGEHITMLLPCQINVDPHVEDTGIIQQIETGMEGIFMPVIYTEDSFMEMFGIVIMYRDIADCGLGDGRRWAFLSTDHGIVFAREAYKGAQYANSLDDIEEYVIEMLS